MEAAAKIVIGTPIILELTGNECYSGKLFKISADRKRIHVTNVTDLKTAKKIQGVQIYYKSELIKVRKMHGSNSPNPGESDADEENANEEDDNGPAGPDVIPSGALNESDLQRIQTNISNAIYIKQCDNRYHEALAELRNQEIIGVSMEGEKYGRLKGASLLVMCTVERIFIFDIKLFGEVFPEIKQILKSPLPRMVVHNVSYVADYLKHKEKCVVKGVFDTFVANLYLQGQKNLLRNELAIKDCLVENSLQKCLQKHLNLPEGLLSMPENIDWDRRPISNDLLFIAASNGAYLLKLFFAMTQNYFARAVFVDSMKFGRSLASLENPVDVFAHITGGKNPGIDSTNNK